MALSLIQKKKKRERHRFRRLSVVCCILAHMILFGWATVLVLRKKEESSSSSASTSNERSIHPSSQRSAPLLRSRVKNQLVDFYVETYRQTVADFIDRQSQSWQLHYTALRKDTRTDQELLQDRLAPRSDLLKVKRALQTPPENLMRGEEPHPLVMDREEDIPGYFEHLHTACAPNATSMSFDDECWGYLDRLARQPSCTNSMDSRYHCNGQAKPDPESTAQELIKWNFFDHSVLHVVILGAGPVGLFLANSLATSTNTPTKILVFENRLEEKGRKKVYSREYISDLSADFFAGLDPMLVTWLDSVHSEGAIRTPIYELETLLLLSCRYRGVQFLYDDYREYERELLQIPNLIVFDATGHRLSPLVRPVQEKYEHWNWGRSASSAFLDLKQYALLKSSSSLQYIAKDPKTSLIYPVTEHGMPYRAYLLKINNVLTDQREWNTLKAFSDMLRSEEFQFCNEDWEFSPCHGLNGTTDDDSTPADEDCVSFCSQFYIWDSTSYFRSDISELYKFGVSEHIATTAAFVSLSPKEADTWYELLQKREGHMRSRYKLSDIPWSLLAQLPENEVTVTRALYEYLAEHPAGDRRAGIDLFSYQPYLYTDPLSPKSIFDGSYDVPLLRVGDSLSSGDPNLSTGLGFHVRLLDNFVKRLGRQADNMDDLVEQALSE